MAMRRQFILAAKIIAAESGESGRPCASSCVFVIVRAWSGAWLPERSRVSSEMTEHGSAGKVMLRLMRRC